MTHTVECLVFAAPPEPGVCLCRGDPHCFPFDADKNNMGDEMLIHKRACLYTMVRDNCIAGSDPSFKVDVNFAITKAGMRRSYVEAVRISDQVRISSQTML